MTKIDLKFGHLKYPGILVYKYVMTFLRPGVEKYHSAVKWLWKR